MARKKSQILMKWNETFYIKIIQHLNIKLIFYRVSHFILSIKTEIFVNSLYFWCTVLRDDILSLINKLNYIKMLKILHSFPFVHRSMPEGGWSFSLLIALAYKRVTRFINLKKKENNKRFSVLQKKHIKL